MLLFRDRKLYLEAQRCCQCGTCLAACTEGALVANQQPDGTSLIICNEKFCTGCGQCVAACPAAVLPKKLLTEQNWESCQAVWLGHAIDSTVRHAASSGGVARILVACGLKSGFCDKAYSVVHASDFPWGEGQYLSYGDDVFSRLTNSMYVPILVNRNLRRNICKVLMVVGTNCQLMAAEQYYRNSNIKLIKVAILCKQQKTKKFTDFMLNRLKVKETKPLKYRGDGWPGFLSFGGNALAYEDAAALPFGKRLWRIAGCRFCGNPLGANSDLTLADPWGILSEKEAGGGKTLIIVHTETGQKLLQGASNALELTSVSVSDAKRSVDWFSIKQQQTRILWRLGQIRNPWLRFVYSIGDFQRRLYEKFLERFVPKSLFLKILNRIPYLG